jgi:hypothetical protein
MFSKLRINITSPVAVFYIFFLSKCFGVTYFMRLFTFCLQASGMGETRGLVLTTDLTLKLCWSLLKHESNSITNCVPSLSRSNTMIHS